MALGATTGQHTATAGSWSRYGDGLEAAPPTMRVSTAAGSVSAGWDAGTGWRCLMPLRNQKTSSIVSTLRAYRRHHETIDKVVADKANELIQAAKEENADALPLVPYRPQANHLEREVETAGDHLKAILVHAGAFPKLWPSARRYVSDIYNLFKQVSCLKGEGDDEDLVTATPCRHRYDCDPPWTSAEVPAFGQTVTVVIPKLLRTMPAGLHRVVLPCSSSGFTLTIACVIGGHRLRS